MSIGRYTRLDEIGRGSFATVYQGVHTVSHSRVARFQARSDADRCALPLEIPHIRGDKVCQPVKAQQETQGQPLVRDRHPQGPSPPAYCRAHRLP